MKQASLQTAVLILIIVITGMMYPPTSLLAVPTTLLSIAIPVAIINGVCEELLWRGLYVKVFPNNKLLGFVSPSIEFAFWHIISPKLVFPAAVSVWPPGGGQIGCPPKSSLNQ